MILLIFIAIILTILGYAGLIWWRYLKGDFQTTVLYPGFYIFPKRISREVRLSILEDFRCLSWPKMEMMEDYLRCYLKDAKINTTDISMSRRDIFEYKFKSGEDKFKYFIFLKEALYITSPFMRECVKPEIPENTKSAINFLKGLNNVVMSKYNKRFISDNDRSVIIAEVIRRISTQLIDFPEPYADGFYNEVVRDTVVAKYEEMISAAVNDPQVVNMLNTFDDLTHPIYNRVIVGKRHTLEFLIKVALLTKWIK